VVALVTGAWGFLGRAIAARLEADGWSVVRAGRPHQELPSTDFDQLFAASVPHVLVHCAGPASVPDSVRDPLRDHAASVGVVAALADSVRRLVPQTSVLFVSSAAVYGEPSSLPVSEDAPLAPISPYGFHRLACELLLRELTVLEGTPTASLRVFSAYGEGQRRRLLWDVCTRGLRDGRVVLSGTGSESRDIVHADDVAAAWPVSARSQGRRTTWAPASRRPLSTWQGFSSTRSSGTSR
jgi:UDP-glucose 4-epimerase